MSLTGDVAAAEGPPNTSRWIWMGLVLWQSFELQQGWQPHIYNHVVHATMGAAGEANRTLLLQNGGGRQKVAMRRR